MSANTQDYYQNRARKARDLAAVATDPKIAAIHLEMAERYELLAVDAKITTLHVVTPDQEQPSTSA